MRTSETDPLRIATIVVPKVTGAIGMTLCPGKFDPHAATGPWCRDLGKDMAAIKRWGAAAIVTLMEWFELEHLHVAELPEVARRHELDWLHLPIRDVSIPDQRFEELWRERHLAERLRRGESLLIHCRGGLGRTGTIAARLLIELGLDADDAIRRVRAARPKAIETREQEAYVRRCGRAP